MCAGTERGSAGCPRSLKQASSLADILSSPSCLATLCLYYLGHIASALNAMPTRPSRVPRTDGQDRLSVLLMWFFIKGSRVEKAFTAAHQACDTIGAGRAWEYVGAKILERFDEHEMRKKVAHEPITALRTLPSWPPRLLHLLRDLLMMH